MKYKIVFAFIFLSLNSNYMLLAQEVQHPAKPEQKHANAANEHMHHTPVEELIKRFESPERDAYQQPEKVMQYLGNLKGKTIMDIGAGSGYFSVKLAAKGARVIAADVDDGFLDFVKKRIEKDGLKNIEVRKIPFDSPSLKGQEVDMVLIVNTYHHIDNRSEYFSKVRYGTKTAGELVIIDFFKTELPTGPAPAQKVSIDEVVAELKKAGYTKFNIDVNLLPYQYIIKAQ